MKKDEDDSHENDDDDSSEDEKKDDVKQEGYKFSKKYVWEDFDDDMDYIAEEDGQNGKNAEAAGDLKKDGSEEDSNEDGVTEHQPENVGLKMSEYYNDFDNDYLYEEDEKEDNDKDEDSEKKDDDDKDSKTDVFVKDDVKSEMRKLKRDDLIIEYNIDGLFKQGNFSPKFKRQVKSMFESAVLANVNANLDYIHTSVSKKAKLEAKTLRENLVNELDSYLSYVVENFLEENKLAVENGLRMEVYENFMHEMRELFERHYIHVPESKVDILDTITEKLEKAETELNEEIQRNMALSEKIEKLKRDRIFENVSVGLPKSHKNRLLSLAENVEFINEHDYKSKLLDMRHVFLSEDTGNRPKKLSVPRKEAFENDYINVSPKHETDILIENTIDKIEKLVRR